MSICYYMLFLTYLLLCHVWILSHFYDFSCKEAAIVSVAWTTNSYFVCVLRDSSGGNLRHKAGFYIALLPTNHYVTHCPIIIFTCY